jgi:integrase
MGRQATGKATLAPVVRFKGGTLIWQARGSIPVRNPDGSIGSRRIERGFGPDITTKNQRQAKCAEWNHEYEERFRNPRQMITFARAFRTYVRKGHPVPMYARQIVEYLGLTQCSDIDDAVMEDLAEELWPEGAAAATVNRHLYSPVLSILRISLKEKRPMLERPKGYRDVTPVIIPPDGWHRAVAAHLNPNQLAFFMFLAMHGRRTREALGRRPGDLDRAEGILDLGKTKTGVRVIRLHPASLELILSMPGWETRKWLFGAGPTSANSWRRDLKAASARAGVPWYTPHQFGRHTSVTRMLRAGYSVAHVADAHGMTAEMVTRRYGHLAKQETIAALHAVGGELYNAVFGGNAGENMASEAHRRMPSPMILPARVVPHKDAAMSPSEGDTLSS